MRRSKLFYLLFCVLLACTAVCAEEIPRAFGSGSSLSHYFPPPHLSPAQMPLFERGELKSAPNPFDQFDWTLTQLLYDADTTHPNYNPDILDAVPTGILFYPVDERAYISTFHTVFFSDDGGFTWENGDPNPIPTYSWHFRFVRRPNYIYGLAANSAIPSEANKDIIYIVNLNSTTYQGFVRRGIFTTPQSAVIDTSQKTVAYWLGHLVLPDLTRLSALGSWDGWALFRGRCTIPCDTDTTVLIDTTIWTETYLDPFNWMSGPLAYVNGFLYLAGSHQWVSRDSGRTWEVRPAADEICDGGVAFVDTLFGWTGGGRISPQSEGWVHRTTDGGHTWSERLLVADYPIRTVHFLDRQVGFAAGGNYEEGIGGIWSTTDGGETWQEDMTVSAEITVLGSHRHSPAYVDVFAAGFFPDFVGGVWHTRLLVPDTTGPVLVARPDTLDFGALLPGERDTLSFWTINFGSDSIIVNGFYISDTVFKALPDTTIFVLVPGDSVEIPVEFHPRSVGIYTATIYISNSEYQDVHVVCRGEGSDVAAHTHESPLPQEASVSVYPNPGNPDFTISFALPTRADIHLSVYNVLGQRVAVLASGPHDAGSHRLIWRADDLPSGIYFVRLEGIPSPKITKLCLLR